MGAAGIGITEAVASADEMRNAQAQGQRGESSQASKAQEELENLRDRVFVLYKKHQESLESQGIDYWGSVKVIFAIESRSQMTAPRWKRLLKLTQDTQNWDKYFAVKLETDTEMPEETEEPQF